MQVLIFRSLQLALQRTCQVSVWGTPEAWLRSSQGEGSGNQEWGVLSDAGNQAQAEAFEREWSIWIKAPVNAMNWKAPFIEGLLRKCGNASEAVVRNTRPHCVAFGWEGGGIGALCPHHLYPHVTATARNRKVCYGSRKQKATSTNKHSLCSHSDGRKLDHGAIKPTLIDSSKPLKC